MKRSVLLLIVLLLGSYSPAWAARIFTTGFEEQSAAATSSEYLLTQWTSASTVTTSATVHSGSRALSLASGAANRVTKTMSASVTSGTYYTRLWVRFSGTATANNSFMTVDDNAGAASWRLRLSTSNVLELINGVSNTIVVTGPTLSANTYYCLEVRHVISNTVGELELRVDGVSQGSQTVADTLNTGVRRWYVGQAETALGITTLYDDIAINDATGSFQTSWPGHLNKIALANVDGNVAMAWEDMATTNPSVYTNVDDTTAGGAVDDSTTYNKEDDTLNVIDRMTVGALPAEVTANADMILFHVYARIGNGAVVGGSKQILLKVWDESGTLTSHANNSECSNGSINSFRILDMGTTVESFPYDLGSRTKANTEAFDMGYEKVTQAARECRVTAIWANVEWTEAVGGAAPTAGRSLLLGLGL